MRHIAFCVVGALVVALCACSRAPQLPVPTGGPVRVVSFVKNPGSIERDVEDVSLPPTSPDYRRLQEWIAANQSGWLPTVESSNDGILVYLPDHQQLQFVGTQVILHTAKGLFAKKVREEDYAFLKAALDIF